MTIFCRARLRAHRRARGRGGRASCAAEPPEAQAQVDERRARDLGAAIGFGPWRSASATGCASSRGFGRALGQRHHAVDLVVAVRGVRRPQQCGPRPVHCSIARAASSSS